VLAGYAGNLQAAILDKESSGDYSAVNSLGYAGGYQFGASALETLGYLKPGTSKAGNKAAMNDPANWTGKGGAVNLDQFLQDTDLQDAIFEQNVSFNLNALRQNGTVDDTTEKDTISGLLAASHLLGANGAANLNSTDANGTSGNDYFLIGSNAYANTLAAGGAAPNLVQVNSTGGFTQQQVTPAQLPQDAVAAFTAEQLSPAALPQDAVAAFTAKQVNNSPSAQPRRVDLAADRESALLNSVVTAGDNRSVTAGMVANNDLLDANGLPPSDMVETFRRGMRSGAESLAADLKYMGAGIDALQGDAEGVADSITNARIAEEFAAIPMEGIETFANFLEEPTVEGFLTQVVSGTGQLMPSVLSTVTGAGVGSIAMVLGKETLKQSSRAAAKNIIKDSLVAVARKKATPDQRNIAQAAFEATQEAHVLARNGFLKNQASAVRSLQRTGDMKTGGVIGAGISEFAPLSGGNISEALESGREIDSQQAIRAGLLALPQAAIGVFGEVGLLKLIGNQAAKKSAGPNSVMGRLAAAAGGGYAKGGALEGAAELAQEEIAIRNRMDMDDTFTDADANLRRLNAGFVGFFGGGAAGGAGSLLAQSANEVSNASLVGIAASVAEKAAGMSDSIKESMTRNRAADDIASAAPDQTTAEAKRDIDAQLSAMVDDTSSKEAVWVSGTEPDERIKGATPNKINKVFVNGKTAWAAFVPGRGTIISTDFDVAEGVVKGQASDTVLAAALGYSNTKTDGDALVVKVVDKYGDVVSEESTNDAGLAAARAAAIKLMPEGGSVDIVSTEEALAERARRNGPEVQMMEDDYDADDPLETQQNSNEEFGDGEFEADVRTHSFIKEGQETDSYQGVDGDNSFSGIDKARAAYIEMVGEDIDWNTPFYKRMSKSMLKTAVKLQEASPDEVINVKINKDGSYRIEIETTPDTQKIRIRDGKGVEDEVSMSEFLRRSISKAMGSKQEYRSVNITAPGSDAAVSVNPVDLMNAGRRIMESIEGSFTGAGAQQSSRQGLLAMLGQLQMAGYEVDIQDVPIADIMANLENPKIDLPPNISNLTVGFNEAGKKIKLGQLLKPYVPGAPTVTNLIEVDDGDGGVRLSSMEREAELGSESDDVVTDSLEMTESSARTPDGIPLTDMNIEDVVNTNTTQNRPIGSAPQTNTDTSSRRPEVNFKTGTTFPFGEVTDLVTSIVSRISRRLKLKNPVAVISLKGFNTATRDQIGSYLINKKTAKGRIALEALETLDLGDNVAVGKFIKQANADGLLAKKISNEVAKVDDVTLLGQSLVMRAAVDVLRKQTTSVRIAEQIAATLVGGFNSKNTYKGYFQKFSNGSVIMINDLHNENEAALAMVAAHEMGHALFKEEINSLFENKPLYNRMYAAFVRDRQKARDEGRPVKQWEREGFEEWYADQVAAWAKNDNQTDKRGASNAVDSHFKRVVAKFKKLWAEMKNHPGQVYRRVNELKPSFAKYMAGVTAARKANNMTTKMPVYNEAGEIVAYKSALGSIVEEATTTPAATAPPPAQEAPQAAVTTDQAAAAGGAGAGNNGGGNNTGADLPTPDDSSFEQKAIVLAVREEIRLQSGAAAREEAWKRKMNDWGRKFAQNNPNAIKILGFLFTADSMMRIVAGDDVANMFYRQSNSLDGGLGFVQSRTLARDRLRAKLFKVLGTDWRTPEVQEALRLAQGKTPTADLKNPKAKQLREYLEAVHKEYIDPSNTNIGFRENYFPVLLNLAEIANDPEIFEKLILESDPKANKKKVRAAIKRMLKYQQATLNPDIDMDMADIDITEPGSDAEASRVLTADSNLDFLRDTLFLQEPEVALMSYLDAVTKRVEWNRHTKSPDGTNKLAVALGKLQPGPRETADAIINAYLGNVTHLSPFWRKTQSYLAALNLVTLLPFAAFASIPDFAGSIVATKEFGGFAMFGKQVVSQMKDREAAKRLAYDIGVVMPEAAANAWMSQADSDMLDPKVRMATDKFFKYTGLTGLTNISREFSAGMAKRFIIEHANNPTERSDRYLKSLGVTYDQVRRWQDNDFSFDGEDGEAVKAALVRFVESSVLRPNAAERPVWASDPRFALIWQLKSFLYAFNKVVLEGMEREIGYRIVIEQKGVAASMAPLLLLTMAAFMPLAALGLELREYAKVGLSAAVGKDGSQYLRSDQMDWGTYFTELFGRAGLDGPIGMLTMAQRSSDWGGSAIATLLGPTAELAEKIVTKGPFDGAYSRVNSPPEAVGAILGVGALYSPRAALATAVGLGSIGALN